MFQHPTAAVVLVPLQFACGHCRALLNLNRFIHFSALRLGPGHAEREALLQQLALSFAAINHLPEEITANADALTVYMQELYSRWGVAAMWQYC